MKKEPLEPKVIILSEHEKVDAEEYVEDVDHVYKKKDEVYKQFKFNSSLFLMRLACFLGLMAMAFVLMLRLIKLILAFIASAIKFFNEKALNRSLKDIWNEVKSAGKVVLSLAVGVINPHWGSRLMSLFFSLKNQSKYKPFMHRFFRFSA